MENRIKIKGIVETDLPILILSQKRIILQRLSELWQEYDIVFSERSCLTDEQIPAIFYTFPFFL